jgi:hypothetical protein
MFPKNRELEIEFRASGDVYRYFDVPTEGVCRVYGGRVEGDLPKPGVQTSRVPLSGRARRWEVSGLRCCAGCMECCHWVQHYAAAGGIPDALLSCRAVQSDLAI